MLTHGDVIKWKHFPLLAICTGNSPVPHKGQWRGALMLSLTSACLNGWVNNREAGDFGRNRAHYDVIVMSDAWRYMASGILAIIDLSKWLSFIRHQSLFETTMNYVYIQNGIWIIFWIITFLGIILMDLPKINQCYTKTKGNINCISHRIKQNLILTTFEKTKSGWYYMQKFLTVNSNF